MVVGRSSSNGSYDDDIPGAPGWVKQLFARVDMRFDTFSDSLALAVGEFKAFRSRIAELEEWRSRAEAEIVELREFRRSLTPPGTPTQSEPPDEVA